MEPELEKLPARLLKKLEKDFGAVVTGPTDIAGGQKRAHWCTREDILVLYTVCRGKWQDPRREFNTCNKLQELYKRQGEWPANIMEMLGYIEANEDEANEDECHGPCVIVRCVQPAGYDAFTMAQHYAFSKPGCVPFKLIMSCMKQLMSAVKVLHGLGLVHLDLKAENCLITKEYELKLCDFGLTTEIGKPYPVLTNPYKAPEHKPDELVKKETDYWGIGYVLWTLATRQGFSETHSKWLCAKRPLALLKETEVIPENLPEEVLHALDGLLRPLGRKQLKGEPVPKERWSMSDLDQWIKWIERSDSASDTADLLTPSSPLKEAKPAMLFTCAKLAHHQTGHAFEVGKDSPLKGKYLGPHEDRDGKLVNFPDQSILDLGHRHEILVLFMQKKSGQMIYIPTAENQLEEGDTVYVGVGGDPLSKLRTSAGVTTAGSDRAEALGPGKAIRYFIEFDRFRFPEACHGYIVGDEETVERLKEKGECVKGCLDMRKKDGINVGGVLRGDKVIFPAMADIKIQRGDECLVCRVPDMESGRTISTLTDTLVGKFLDRFEVDQPGAAHPQKKQDEQACGGYANQQGATRTRAVDQAGYPTVAATKCHMHANPEESCFQCQQYVEQMDLAAGMKRSEGTAATSSAPAAPPTPSAPAQAAGSAGTAATSSAPAAPPTPSAPAQAAGSAAPPFCRCGRQFSAKGKYCPNCRTPRPVAQAG